MLIQNIIVGLFWACVTLINQSVSDKILWLASQSRASKFDLNLTYTWHMTPIWMNYLYKLMQTSTCGGTNSCGRLLLQTFDSNFAHFITSIHYHFACIRSAHGDNSHDHKTKTKTWNVSISRWFITPTTRFEVGLSGKTQIWETPQRFLLHHNIFHRENILSKE